MRLALGIEYDGSPFSGWQIQPDAFTIQGEVERGLSQIAAGPIRVFCAGRTDAGVHATYQIVHFDTEVVRPSGAWVRGLNALVSENISALWATEVAPDFHARYSALRRTYRYFLLNREQRPALLAKKIGWYHRTLDVQPMSLAASTLIGQHDFSAFRSSECQAKSPVRTVEAISVRAFGDVIIFDITANAFLHHMVRNIVGTLVYIGAGKQSVDWMREILKSRDRSIAAPTFSPNGLYLISVNYDPQWKLPDARMLSGGGVDIASFVV